MVREQDIPDPFHDIPTDPKTLDENWSIVSRPPKDLWGMFSLFFFFAMLVLCLPLLPSEHRYPPPSPVALWGFAVGLSAFFLLVAGMVLHTLLLVHVTAGPQGIRWRDRLGPERFVAWEDVADYYYRPLFVSHQTYSNDFYLCRSAILVTRAGEKIAFPNAYQSTTSASNIEAFCAVVLKYATSAKVKEWGVLGTRSVDEWPQTFQYCMTSLVLALFASFGLPIFALMATLITFYTQWHKTVVTAQAIGWGWAFAPYLVVALLITTPSIALALFSLSYRRDWQKMRHDRFVVTREELHYESPTQTLTVSWSEVVDYFRKSSALSGESTATGFNQYVLVLAGRDERQIEFSDRLQNSYLLARIIACYAGKPTDEEAWRVGSSEKEQEQRKRWQTDTGRVVFTYQQGEGKLLRWILFGTVLALSTIPVLRLLMGGEWSEERTSLIVSGGIGLLVVLSEICVRFASVEIDDFGITQKSLFGTKRVLWLAMEDYGYNPNSLYSYFVKGRDGKRVRILSFIGGVKELKAEITRRAPAPHTGWKA